MIIISLPCLLVGGTEFQTLQLVKALKSFNQNVVVLVYFEVAAEMIQLYEKEGIEVEVLDWERSLPPWLFVKKLRLVFKQIKPSVVHVQYLAPGALPIIAAKLAGVPRIMATVHQPYTISHGGVAKLLLRVAALFCNPFLSVSQNAAISWFGKTTLIDNKIPIVEQSNQLTLYNTIDVEKINYLKNLKPQLLPVGLKLDETIIGTVSRLRHEKGIDLLIQAFYRVFKQNSKSNAQLLIIGDGPQAQEYQQLVKTLQIDERVFFIGAKDWESAMQYMGIMNIVVVPSRFEGFGLTAAEAMAMEKPLICSNAFGLCELVTHNQEGLLFQNGDAEDLQKQLENLINNPDKSKQLGKQAFVKVKQNFDYPIFLNRIKTLYQL